MALRSPLAVRLLDPEDVDEFIECAKLNSTPDVPLPLVPNRTPSPLED
jgi:hypothetical protein